MKFRITIDILDDENQIIITPEAQEILLKISTSPTWDAWMDSIIKEVRNSAKST